MSKKVEIRQVRISKTPKDCECCWSENCELANDEFPQLVKVEEASKRATHSPYGPMVDGVLAEPPEPGNLFPGTSSQKPPL